MDIFVERVVISEANFAIEMKLGLSLKARVQGRESSKFARRKVTEYRRY
jgi:hypothetical protein